MISPRISAIVLTFIFGFLPSTARAADGATLVLREGQVLQLNFGYKQLAEAFKSLNAKAGDRKIVELTIEGGSFLVDMSEVVVVCRDECTSLTVRDPRSEKGRK